MPTHRSLNKLEFKAHMSIHNYTSVSPREEKLDVPAYTRDRFGKIHPLSGNDLRLCLVGRQVFMGTALLLASLAALPAAFADALIGPVGKKGPNVQVSSTDPEVDSIDNWLDRQGERPIFYDDGSMAMGFNEDGDPNVSHRF